MASVSLAARVVTGRAARRRYRTATYRETPVPTARELHMLDRMGCGFSPSAFAQLRRAGGDMEWFEQQLEPESVRESRTARNLPGWFPRLADSPATKMANDQDDTYANWMYGRDLSNYSLLRRIYSNRSVLESMVEFWSNHLHVESRHFPAFTNRAGYDETIRAHALGTFEELLVTATLHPAMLLYLDNWKSSRLSPNENHGRELLELHTVGRDAGYTEAEVKDSARILSGHTVLREGWVATFDSSKHATGAVSVLGFTHPNDRADNAKLAQDYLRHLARHPATARRIAWKLAVRFVSDDPSDALVDHVARAYRDSGTDIKATLRALVRTDEFRISRGQKVRTPADDLVATCRVLRIKAKSPVDTDSFAHELSYALDSTLCYQWPRPDGPPERAGAWASTSRMLNSWRMHWQMSGGYWPTGRVKHRSPRDFLPQERIRFDQFVDHMSRVILGRPSTPTILEAACRGTDIAPDEQISKGHAVMTYKFPKLLGALLDTPAHMTR